MGQRLEIGSGFLPIPISIVNAGLLNSLINQSLNPPPTANPSGELSL